MPTSGAGCIPQIYALADLDALDGVDLSDAVERMADSGIGWIQVRAKRASDEELARLVERCCSALEGSEAKLWLNDRPDLAAMFPVSGVHLGQDDLPPAAARKVLDAKVWIGRSTHDLRQVGEAEADPAVDVVAIGPVFATTGKLNPEPTVGLEGVRQARQATGKPLVAIGGIDEDRITEVLAAGADCVATMGAVCHGTIEHNCRRLIARVEASL